MGGLSYRSEALPPLRRWGLGGSVKQYGVHRTGDGFATVPVDGVEGGASLSRSFSARSKGRVNARHEAMVLHSTPPSPPLQGETPGRKRASREKACGPRGVRPHPPAPR